ncbi:unnamed protein product, partial [marine sediment metagenome]
GTHVFREALRGLDVSRRYRALAFADRANGEAVFVIPQTTDGTGPSGGPASAYTMHYLEPVGSAPVPMTMRDLPATCTGSHVRTGRIKFDDLTEAEWKDYKDFKWNDRFFSDEFPEIIFGDEDGYVYTLGTSNQKDGASMVSNARFSRFSLAGGSHVGVATRLEPFMHRKTTYDDFRVLLWGVDYYDGSVSLSKVKTLLFDMTNSSGPFLSPRFKARFMELEYQSTGNSPWESVGYAIESIQAGERVG